MPPRSEQQEHRPPALSVSVQLPRWKKTFGAEGVTPCSQEKPPSVLPISILRASVTPSPVSTVPPSPESSTQRRVTPTIPRRVTRHCSTPIMPSHTPKQLPELDASSPSSSNSSLPSTPRTPQLDRMPSTGVWLCSRPVNPSRSKSSPVVINTVIARNWDTDDPHAPHHAEYMAIHRPPRPSPPLRRVTARMPLTTQSTWPYIARPGPRLPSDESLRQSSRRRAPRSSALQAGTPLSAAGRILGSRSSAGDRVVEYQLSHVMRA